MFGKRKKIRELEEKLNSHQDDKNWSDLVDSIMANKPAEPTHAFANSLKTKLLEQHQNMSKSKDEKAEKKPSLWSDFRMRGWSFAFVTLIVFVLASVVAYPFIPAPTVHGYILKGANREISVNAPLKISFSQLMNNDSVEEAFNISPELPGTMKWEGNSLIYIPTEPLEIGDNYEITIGTGALSIFQKPLAGGYSESYTIVAAPKILLLTPNDASIGVPTDTEINIMFDRPVTGLTTLSAGRDNFPDIKIEPKLAGRFKWLGTSTLQFLPEKMNLATEYKVTVPEGTKVLDGGYTEDTFASVFETARPISKEVTTTDTQTFEQVSSNSAFKISLNQKVDLSSAQDMIKLHRVDDNKNNVENINIRYFTVADWKAEQKRSMELTEMEHYEEIEEATSEDSESTPPEVPELDVLEKNLMVTPVLPIKSQSNYFLEVRTGLKGFEGPLTTDEDANYAFRSMGDLDLISTDSGVELSKDSVHPVFAYSNPVDLRSFRGKISIEPSLKDDEGKVVEPDLRVSGVANIHIDYDYLPSTDYVISIAPGVKDILGNAYDEKSELSFKSPALKPALALEKGTDVSVVDGYQPTKFYLKSVNADFADVQLKKLTTEQFSDVYFDGYINYKNVNMARFGDTDFDGRLQIEQEFNTRGHTLMNLDNLTGDRLGSGFYYMEISNPNVTTTVCRYEWETDNPGCDEVMKNEKTIFIISKSSLALKTSQSEMLVWATDLKDGEPVSGETITVLSRGRKEIGTAETDVSGVAKISLPDGGDDYYREYLVIGERGGDVAFVHSSWSEGIAPWNFNINTQPVAPEYYTYLYTDRPIYRPGQEVFFKGIIRQEENYKFKLPKVEKVKVVIRDSQGNDIYDEEIDITNNGTFSGIMTLGDSIPTGNFSWKATLVGAEGPSWMKTFNSSFKVYEYRKPEYKLDLVTEKDSFVNGESATVNLEAGYFFGAPLPDAKVKWTLKAQDYYFILPEELASKLSGSWFSFADEGFFCYWGCGSSAEVVSQGETVTDGSGLAKLTLPLNINDKKISQIYTLETSVTDANNQSVSNRITFPVHKGDFYVGIRSQDYLVTPDKPAKFDILTVSRDGEELSGKSVDVTLYKRVWNTVKRKNVDGDFYFENSYDDEEVNKTSIRTGADALGTAEFTITEGGVYKVEASASDSTNNVIKSSTTVYVSSGDFINWGTGNNDQIELITDKLEYKLGETAKVLVKSPYKNVYALVTYERDRVLDHKIVKLESNSDTIEVPITERFLPNAFVSVVLMKGDAYDAGLVEPAEGAPDERQIAAFKVGYTTLQVNTESKRLDVEIDSNKERYAPGETVTLNLKTTDYVGQGVPAELSVAVVDESVLSLTESVTADLLNVFYRKRMLGVEMAHTLTKALSRVNVQVEAGMKGGGGGDNAKRGIFKDTAHFESTVSTSATGEATIEFKLPDNLTTWQVMAIGITDDTGGAQALVGSGKHSFLANKDILARPVLPRFMTVGDEMKVSAIVHNYADEEKSVEVTLESEQLFLKDSAKKKTNIASKGSKQVDWMVKVGKEGEAKLIFTAVANGGESGDTIEQILPIKEGTMLEQVALGKIITGDAKEIEEVWLPNGLNLEHGNLKVTAAATLAGSIGDGLKYLVNFPYGCSEQIASAILPNIAAKRLLDTGSFSFPGYSSEQIDSNVNTGLQELYRKQKPGGGFGLWTTSTPTAYLSAYVTQTMYEAKQAGYTVDEKVLEKASKYLKTYLSKKPNPKESESYRLNTRAYVLFVLDEIGQGDLGLLNNLYGEKEKIRLISKAYLIMALNNHTEDESSGAAVAEKVAVLKKELENSAKLTPRGVTFEELSLDFSLFDSNTRTTAVVLKSLNRLDTEHVLIPRVMQSLLRERKGGHFATTQETALSILAMIEYLEASKELSPAYQALVDINGEVILDTNFTSENVFDVKEVNVPLTDLLPNNLDNIVAAQKLGEGRMYLDLNLEYYLPLLDLKAENEGLEVLQEYYAVEDTAMTTPLNEVKVGENLHARMTVIVPHDRHYVMIEDFLPAGLEGIDFNLKTSEQGLKETLDDDCQYACYFRWYFNHSEVRDDRVMYFADFLPKGVYEIDYFVRSTSIGDFADLPALAQETYFPEVFGRSEGKKFKVTE